MASAIQQEQAHAVQKAQATAEGWGDQYEAAYQQAKAQEAAQPNPIRDAICWPTYGIVNDLVNQNYDNAAAKALCPIGVSSIYDATECWEAGKAAAGAADILLPNLVPAGSFAGLAKETGADTAITNAVNQAMNPTTNVDLSTANNAEAPTEEAVTKALKGDDGAKEAIDSRRIASAEDDVTRRAAYRAARNAGANRAASSAMAGAQTDGTNQSSALSAARNAGNLSQNDWLQKQGYATGLAREAENKKKGAFLDTLGGIFGGAGSGASTGASLGGSK